MGIRSQRHLSFSPERLSETRIAREVRPHHQSVDKESDQSFNLFPRPVRDRGPDTDVLLSAVPHQERLEGRRQRHKESHSLSPAKPSQTFADFPANFYPLQT